MALFRTGGSSAPGFDIMNPGYTGTTATIQQGYATTIDATGYKYAVIATTGAGATKVAVVDIDNATVINGTSPSVSISGSTITAFNNGSGSMVYQYLLYN